MGDLEKAIEAAIAKFLKSDPCPFCKKAFKAPGGRNYHMRQRTCRELKVFEKELSAGVEDVEASVPVVPATGRQTSLQTNIEEGESRNVPKKQPLADKQVSHTGLDNRF